LKREKKFLPRAGRKKQKAVAVKHGERGTTGKGYCVQTDQYNSRGTLWGVNA